MPNKTDTTEKPVRDLFYEGVCAGRKQERDHCNFVLKQFFKTFKFGETVTVEQAEEYNAKQN